MASYPVTENVHSGGILIASKSPVDSQAIDDDASDYLARLMNHLDYVGVLALEYFVAEGQLLANEFAPRVHNSGHWTIEGTACSQFENHVRAVLDLPLGDCAATSHAAMINLLGEMPRNLDQLVDSGWAIHDYGKAPRPGRKLGHATLTADTAAERDQSLAAGLAAIGG